MPLNLGFGELLVVMVVALLVFGGRLPQVGRSIGQGLRQFKKGLSESAEETRRAVEEEEARQIEAPEDGDGADSDSDDTTPVPKEERTPVEEGGTGPTPSPAP